MIKNRCTGGFEQGSRFKQCCLEVGHKGNHFAHNTPTGMYCVMCAGRGAIPADDEDFLFGKNVQIVLVREKYEYLRCKQI